VANQFLDDTIYVNSMLLLVENHLVMGKLVSNKFQDKVNDHNRLKVYEKRPSRFTVTDGATLQLQDSVTGSANIAIDKYKGVHISVGDLEWIQSYNDLMQNQDMKSAASAIAQAIDSNLHTQLLKFPSWVNAPGSTATDYALATPQQFIPVRTRLENLSAPSSDRVSVFSTEDSAGVMGSLIDKFMSSTAVDALKNARIPMLSGIDNYETQATRSLTTGTRTTSGAAQVDGAAENVNYRDVKDVMTQTLSLKGLTNGHTIKAGEVFTIAGVFAVNQRTQETLTYLQQFTVTADVTVTGTTEDVTIRPAIIVTGTTDGTSVVQNTVFATVNSVPADSAAVTWSGNASSTFRQRAAWHKSAIQLVSARLRMPDTGVASFAVSKETGIGIRYWRGSDIATGAHIHRWDCTFGSEVMDPMLGTRFSGTA